LTDRELFNKRNKEVTSSKKSYYKEKAEYIESINDIQEGEYVVHNIHGVGIYKGLTQQEIDGQLKDYLTIEYASNDKLHIPAEQINLLCRYRGSGSIKPKLSRMGGKDWENTKKRAGTFEGSRPKKRWGNNYFVMTFAISRTLLE
jgi:transcription-repair coupling factor (superfamily II helicase)